MNPRPSPDEAFLAAHDLQMHFGGLVALSGVNLNVRRNEIYGLLGPNGAGKTTLFNIIAGVYQASQGSVIFQDKPINRLRPDQRCRLGIARTFQITQPFGELTVQENVMVGAMTHNNALTAMREEAKDHIEVVGLWAKRNEPAKTLSTGQRKRLELARALATRPTLLLMDEVTGGVDQPSIPGLIDLVSSLRDRGITLVLIEHNMAVMTELADHLTFLSRGSVLCEGKPKDVMQEPAVVELYLGAGAHA